MEPRQSGETKYGKLLDREESVASPYTEYVEYLTSPGSIPDAIAIPNAEVTVIDANAVNVKIFDVVAAGEALGGIFHSFYTRVQLDLPSVLTNIEVYYNSATGTGTDVHSGQGYSAGDSWSFGLNLPGRGTSSASLAPEVVPIVRSFRREVNATMYAFYLAGDVSMTQILTRIGTELSVTINPWPGFTPETFTIVCFGQQANLTADVNAQQSVSASDTNTTFTKNTGQGYSVQTGVSISKTLISDVIHGAIVVADASLSVSVNAVATAGWSTGTNFPALSVTSTAPTKTLLASVEPAYLAPTSPATVPVTGLYLTPQVRVQNFRDGWTQVLATVVDMSQLGPSLSALTVSAGSFSPTFMATTLRYRMNYNNSPLTFTPTRNGTTATITVNGSTTTSGAASSNVTISVGKNYIPIVVTDNGESTTYLVTVTRP